MCISFPESIIDIYKKNPKLAVLTYIVYLIADTKGTCFLSAGRIAKQLGSIVNDSIHRLVAVAKNVLEQLRDFGYVESFRKTKRGMVYIVTNDFAKLVRESGFEPPEVAKMLYDKLFSAGAQ